MKIRVDGGWSVTLDHQRSTSASGGVYDISELSARDRERVLALDCVELLEVDATDSARQLARDNDVDLREIEGTGEDGRILKGDVQDAIDNRDQE